MLRSTSAAVLTLGRGTRSVSADTIANSAGSVMRAVPSAPSVPVKAPPVPVGARQAGLRSWQQPQRKSAFERLSEANEAYWQKVLTPADRQARSMQACLALVRLYLKRRDYRSAAQVLDDAVSQLARVSITLNEQDREALQESIQQLRATLVVAMPSRAAGRA